MVSVVPAPLNMCHSEPCHHCKVMASLINTFLSGSKGSWRNLGPSRGSDSDRPPASPHTGGALPVQWLLHSSPHPHPPQNSHHLHQHRAMNLPSHASMAGPGPQFSPMAFENCHHSFLTASLLFSLSKDLAAHFTERTMAIMKQEGRGQGTTFKRMT